MKEVARMLSLLLSIYNFLIIIRIFSSWIEPFRKIASGGIMDFIANITDPFLNIFRKIKFMQYGRLDFSVLLAFMSISVAQNLLLVFSTTGKMTLGFALGTILDSLWRSLGSLLLGILIILLIIRIFLSYKKTPNSIQYIQLLDQWLSKVLNTFHSIIFSGKEVSDRTLLFTSLGVSIAVYVLIMQLVRIGVQALYKLPF